MLSCTRGGPICYNQKVAMLLNDGLQFSGGRYSQGQTWQWLLRLLQNGASCGGDLVGRLVACFGVAHLVVLSSAWAAIREPKWAAVKGVV